MGQSIVQKILSSHLVEGRLMRGKPISIAVDQTLSTGGLAYLQFEAMGAPDIETKRSVAYIGDNIENSEFIHTFAKKHGIYFSPPENGIAEQVHMARFAAPGMTLLGDDRLTPACGSLGMIAIGGSGIEVAAAMALGNYHTFMPSVFKVELTGTLNTDAKEIAVELLRQLRVFGDGPKIIEYCGEGVESLSTTQRATIASMSYSLGAITSVFPSDDNTRAFMKMQGREDDVIELSADDDAEYDQVLKIDISAIIPSWADDMKKLDFSDNFEVKADSIVPPADTAAASSLEVVKGANIKPLPSAPRLKFWIEAPILLKMGDDVTTEDIIPRSTELAPYALNIPYLSDYCLTSIDADFPKRAREEGMGILIAGKNYGKGENSELAALVLQYLNIKCVYAISFDRQHSIDLFNAGIMALEFDEDTYENTNQGDLYDLIDTYKGFMTFGHEEAANRNSGEIFFGDFDNSDRIEDMTKVGGLLNYINKVLAR